MTLRTLLSLLNNISATRIVGPPALDENSYEISASLTTGNKNDLELLLALAIESSLKVKVRRETREMDAFVLSAPKQSEMKLRPNASEMGHWSDDEGVMAASAAPFRALLDGIEGVLKQPVFDETNLNGKYDWDIVFDGKNPESIIEAIHKDLGLELKRARRQIEVLVVEME
jgi:uncharacterized protein (TIGR03435 family)